MSKQRPGEEQRPGEGARTVFGRDGLQALIDTLASRGFRVLGPTPRDGAIVYDDVAKVDDLPSGWGDRQEAGRYRLERRGDDALFAWTVGPQSWKRFLFPPKERLWSARREGESFTVTDSGQETEKLAFFGARSCELRAIAIQDRVFCEGPYADPRYSARRGAIFTVAVNCGHPGRTCFCASMDAGPEAREGYDIVLTELLDADGQRFVAEAGSPQGASVLESVPGAPARARDLAAVEDLMSRAAAGMGRSLRTDDVKALLQGAPHHPRWDDVAQRCLACTNCTMVCPTCFCATVEDHTDLATATAERVRRWDSCFTQDHSYIHGGSVRASTRSRYRQWLTHKLASWIDQFGVSGCVGCGRCISWCPAGIDITEEVAAIRAGRTVPREESHGRT